MRRTDGGAGEVRDRAGEQTRGGPGGTDSGVMYLQGQVDSSRDGCPCSVEMKRFFRVDAANHEK